MNMIFKDNGFFVANDYKSILSPIDSRTELDGSRTLLLQEICPEGILYSVARKAEIEKGRISWAEISRFKTESDALCEFEQDRIREGVRIVREAGKGR